MTDLYRVNHVEKHSHKRRRRVVTIVCLLVLLGLGWFGYGKVKLALKPSTELTQAAAVTKTVTTDAKTKHYDVEDFGIDLPVGWEQLPSPPGNPYKSYRWQQISKANGRLLEIFKDTIPPNYAVNRTLVLQSSTDTVQVNGNISDNCKTFTKDLSYSPNQIGTAAKWMDVDFLCDQANVERDVIGTTSTEGVNKVTIKNGSTGAAHVFFFSYTEHALQPDYSVFLDALASFRMQ